MVKAPFSWAYLVDLFGYQREVPERLRELPDRLPPDLLRELPRRPPKGRMSSSAPDQPRPLEELAERLVRRNEPRVEPRPAVLPRDEPFFDEPALAEPFLDEPVWALREEDRPLPPPLRSPRSPYPDRTEVLARLRRSVPCDRPASSLSVNAPVGPRRT
jgi:hypothetical protein